MRPVYLALDATTQAAKKGGVMSIFLDDDDMVALTGFKMARKQIAQLKVMGIPFRINGHGKPVVALTVIQGGKPVIETRTKVTPPSLLR